MTDATLHDLILAVPPTLAALGALVVSIINRKRTKGDIEEVKKEVTVLTVSIDGRMENLLKLTKELGHSEGQAEGKEQERGERRSREELQHVAEKADLIAETVVDTHERVKTIEAEVVGGEKREG